MDATLRLTCLHVKRVIDAKLCEVCLYLTFLIFSCWALFIDSGYELSVHNCSIKYLLTKCQSQSFNNSTIKHV
jgi:hypothetical protein